VSSDGQARDSSRDARDNSGNAIIPAETYGNLGNNLWIPRASRA
ncbi:12650_t:CDS:1, partial [Cetraspora pellucida]